MQHAEGEQNLLTLESYNITDYFLDSLFMPNTGTKYK